MDKKEKAKEKRERRRQEISLLRTIPYSDHRRWWSSETVAVVTGANRGIGFEIVHQLALHGLTVVLTSREAAVGEEAAKVLQEGGLNVVFHQLDIVNPSSIEAFVDWIKESYGGVDILVNNAGVNFNSGSDNSMENAENVIRTNYFGTKNMIKAMIPAMRASEPGARIVNVSSKLGRLNAKRHRLENDEWRQKLENDAQLSEELIDEMVNAFLDQVNDGTWEDGGWPPVSTDYSLSKLAVNTYTRLMAREFSDRPEGEKIYINCYCPGWVRTAMTGWKGNVTPEEGADTAVWLALLPDQSITGKFFYERHEIHF
ncbi:uncharacterized protein LOC127263014 isoform X2 [Andrographis paniculata]|uniref:uncharacterized protein LOC127263014 isoform X2 n=1 Tax=Andrographis paniculata TaxID=175694 RepID=UPI0021E75275|nr:uncharacterized protein LOC127263014 isoform X2 [Andrographis paniculata]